MPGGGARYTCAGSAGDAAAAADEDDEAEAAAAAYATCMPGGARFTRASEWMNETNKTNSQVNHSSVS